MYILHSVLVLSVTEADSSHGRSQLKLSPAAVFKLYGDGWPQPSRWRALYHRQIFFTGFGNIFPRIVQGHIYQAVTSHNTHLFCLKCEDCVSWSSWLGDLHSYTCVEIRSSPPPPESYNIIKETRGSSRQNRSLDLTDIESGSKCLADFLSFSISFFLSFVKLRSSWIWKIGKWDTNIHSHFLESVSGGPMSVPGFN